MVHSLFIAAHAACAIAAFVLGLVVVWHPAERGSARFRGYLSTLMLMLVFLVAVVLVDWAGLDTIKRGVFSGLLLLAAYTGWRGWQAAQELAHRRPVWRDAYIEDVGFTLVALFDGFVIVSAIDLGAPLWLVLTIGLFGIVVGRLGVLQMKRRAIHAAPVLAG